MKKTALLLFLLIGGLFFVAPVVVFAETIKSFDVVVEVRTDNAITVTETIVYDSEGFEKHGIFRTIRRDSFEGRKMNIVDVSVEDQFGTSYQFERQTASDTVTLKIGDPNNTFSGEKTYVIRYRAVDAIAHLEGKDELYWNVTGNEWPFTIGTVSAEVALPTAIVPTSSACYYGPLGSTQRCDGEDVTRFSVAQMIAPGDGVTIAVGFPKGILPEYAPPSFFEKYWVYILSILIPFLLFIGMYARWRKYGRDPKGTGVVVAQYDVLNGLTPLEVGTIVYQKTRTKDISAELIYLAVKGYLKIKQFEKKNFGILKNTDYELTLLKDITDLPEFDQKLLSKLFLTPVVGSVVTLSSLNNKFYTAIHSIMNSVKASMISKQYYSYLPITSSPLVVVPWVPILVFFFFGLITIDNIDQTFAMKAFSLSGSFIISSTIYLVFNKLMPAKTKEGVAMEKYFLGLKEYLQIAEKDRLQFHNAPEKKPEVFEKLLPYAMVFGVEKSWAKEFETLYTVPPSWYEGSSYNAFSAVAFTQSMDSFSASAFSALTHSPRSSGGSGGGGSSGGGGGGGGGGSW